jgi:NodT family efflux transporter outer membrane factor (OMF) lipoprotein
MSHGLLNVVDHGRLCRSRVVRVLSLIGALWLFGCAVGPDYEPPDFPVPKVFGARLETPVQASSFSEETIRWWQTLHDPKLNSLVERAIGSNLDIEIALARVQAARTQEFVVIGAALPRVGISAGTAIGSGTDLIKGRAASSLDAGTNTTGLIVTSVAGFDAGWELDLFGKQRRLLEAARADAEALIELRNVVMITVIADIVRNYIDVRGLQSRLEIARRNVGTAQKTVELAQSRYSRGLTNELDVTLAMRQLATVEAYVPEINAMLSVAENRLSVLLGTYPGLIHGQLNGPGKLPHIPRRLRPGVPIDLLRRRPDIRRAERELAAATARIGVATADLFPSVALLAGFGAQGGERQGSAAPIHGPIWSFGPGAYWPFLDFGRLDALIDVQELRTHELLVNYKRNILVAVTEVDNAVKQFRAQQQRLKDLARALEESRRAVSLSTERYETGLTDFLNVLDAQRQQYELEDQNAIAAELLTIQLIVFYKALGGGWELFQSLPPPPRPEPAILATLRRLSGNRNNTGN